ncbi:MAG: aldo/keto reductase [Proteobacteria bacterium]|nr:aldo/keto reductase [Pseudomonadota bacterium]
MTLPTRQLGPLTVSAIGLGCMNICHAYGIPPPEEDAGKLLNRALDLGVTFLDTAAIYGLGQSERLIQRYVMHRKAEFILASKCVMDAPDGKTRVLDARPAAIAATLDRALQRLGADRIDLYYLHRPDRNVPIEESVGALKDAVQAGKIGAIGLSEMGAALIRRAHAVHPIAAVQSEYSPMVRNPEVAVLDTCRELGIGFVAFSPVARGMLAGAVRDDAYEKHDIRTTMPRFLGDNLRHNLGVVARFEALAADLGHTPAQLALAWVLAKGEHIVPIPGTRRIAHLEEDAAAVAISLTPDMIAAVDGIFAGTIRGARYSAPAQATVDTELLPDEELA